MYLCHNVPEPSFLCSVALNIINPIRQKPRFYGVMTYKPAVVIYCLSPKQNQSATVEWYKANKYNEVQENRIRIYPDGKKIEMNPREITTLRSILQIFNPRIMDTGVYFCKLNDEWGPGTEVQITSKRLELHVFFAGPQTHDALSPRAVFHCT